ncbi:MAG: NAD(P)H-dependent oxidoreductase [Ilumatobacter sp.]|nr:NAD(P)H-dependent oxidoreductase [Ilumatobacter sp.]
MKALIVLAHPCEDSFCHAAADAARRGLVVAGHDVTVLDLYRDGFRAAMSHAERTAYHSDEPILDQQVADHAARVRDAEILVFVYPTWWSGLPAILKGWLERVMVPGVGFVFDEHGKVRPGLPQVRRIVGISTYGSPRWYVWLVNDNGRRVLTRALRLSCGWRARPRWHPLAAMDTTTVEKRAAFLDRIEARIGR